MEAVSESIMSPGACAMEDEAVVIVMESSWLAASVLDKVCSSSTLHACAVAGGVTPMSLLPSFPNSYSEPYSQVQLTSENNYVVTNRSHRALWREDEQAFKCDRR